MKGGPRTLLSVLLPQRRQLGKEGKRQGAEPQKRAEVLEISQMLKLSDVINDMNIIKS